MRTVIILLAFLVCCMTAIQAQKIDNIEAEAVGGKIRVTCTLQTASPVDLTLSWSDDGGQSFNTCVSVSGDLFNRSGGTAVIEWDCGKDGIIMGDFIFKITSLPAANPQVEVAEIPPVTKPSRTTETKPTQTTHPNNLHMKRTTSRRSNLLFAAGGVSIAAGVAASILFTKPYTEEKNSLIIKGKEHNLVYAAAGVVTGGVCIGSGISLKKKARLQPQNIDYSSDHSRSPVYRDNHLHLNLVAYGNEAGLRLTF